MKVYISSLFIEKEMVPGETLFTIPYKAHIEIIREKTDAISKIYYNGLLIDNNLDTIDCFGKGVLEIIDHDKKSVYTVLPTFKLLSSIYVNSYDQFFYEFNKNTVDEIRSIQSGFLKLYAIEQSTQKFDHRALFNKLDDAFKNIRKICEKPRSHLKSENDVRPIETVKRIGYEAIPYLASHSEDWLARTASGLKPARLFSRIEEEDFHIYENRVVKTLIDKIISFLNRKDTDLKKEKGQLDGIMNGIVQTDSFGFDASFQKAVSELLSSDEHRLDISYREKELKDIGELHRKAKSLQHKYLLLRQSRLYRYLNKSKKVSNPLNETNILKMDKQYKTVFQLWTKIYREIIPQKDNEIDQDHNNDWNNYKQFCTTLCGFAAHMLNFECVKNGLYKREKDHIQMSILSTERGVIKVILTDTKPRSKVIPSNIEIPIKIGETSNRIKFTGESLIWPNDITDKELDDFCSIFKTKSSRGREQSDEKRKYDALKEFLYNENRTYGSVTKSEFLIIPLAIELVLGDGVELKKVMNDFVTDISLTSNTEFVVALPTCSETEQKITEYAREDDQKYSILPLSMFDINSFRRFQNILYKQIIKLGKNSCPNCGGELVKKENNQFICRNCNDLTITKTTCQNCKKEYQYMSYNVSDEIIKKMEKVKEEDFFKQDSLFQYKNVVNMMVDVKAKKIRTICPHCHK